MDIFGQKFEESTAQPYHILEPFMRKCQILPKNDQILILWQFVFFQIVNVQNIAFLLWGSLDLYEYTYYGFSKKISMITKYNFLFSRQES